MDRIAQAALLGLIDGMNADFGDHIVDARQQLFLPAGVKPGLEFLVRAKVLLDRLLPLARDEQHIIDPRAAASSMTYWIVGRSRIGNSSFGTTLAAGSMRVPKPAAGMTALVMLIQNVHRGGTRSRRKERRN